MNDPLQLGRPGSATASQGSPFRLRTSARRRRPLSRALSLVLLALIPMGTALAAKPTVSIDDVEVVEGARKLAKQTMDFTVSLSEKADQRVSVRVETSNGTAVSGSDYDAANRVIYFLRGQTRQTFTVRINGDAAAERDETFSVNLSQPDGLQLGKRRGTGTIIDDDTPPADILLSVADASVTEGNGERRTLRFVVSARPTPSATVTVRYATSNGSARSGSDYQATSGTLSFGSGVATQIVEVPVIGDTVKEADETMTLSLSAPTGRGRLDRATGTGTIIDDDQGDDAGTPQPFAFTPLADVEPGSVQTSDAVQILGLAAPTAISITGGSYSINGQPFTEASGSIADGDIVELRAQASTAFATSSSARLSIGSAVADFVLETRLRDTTPEPFGFEPAFSAAAGSNVISAPITVGGIDSGTRISVTGGSYQIDSGAWTTAPGTISAGRRVRLSVTAGSSGVTTAELRIGQKSARFSVTAADGKASPRAFSLGSMQSFPLLLGSSDAVVIAGLAAPTRISIRNGRYRLNGGAYTDLPGIVVNGDTLRVGIIAAPMRDERTEATLTIGAFSTRFSVATAAPEDRMPDVLQLPLGNAVPISTPAITPAMPIKGVNVPVSITVSAGLSYSVNDAPFTASPGSVRWGDRLRLRMDIGPEYARNYTGNVTIGNATTTWQLRSESAPARPARFTLAPASIYTGGLALPGSVQTSEPITVSNAGGPQTVTVTGGQYRINDGAYRSSAGTASDGDRITVRTVLPPTFSTDKVVTLKVGATSSSLTLTTTIDAVANTPTTVAGSSQSHVIRTDGVVPLRAFVIQPPGWRATDRRAAYIDWSGGGWARGGQPSNRARNLADEHGMVVIAPDQRVNDRFGTYAYVHADDARRVLKWAQDNAAQLGIDAARVVVAGSSSGGGNAVWAVLLEPPTTVPTGSTPTARAAAVVLRSGVTSTSDDAALGRSQRARFGSFVDAISPDRQIDAAIAPFLFFHGDADVVFAQTANLNLCTQIRLLGQDCDFQNQAGLGHDWTSDAGKLEESRSVELAFLTRIGILPALR